MGLQTVWAWIIGAILVLVGILGYFNDPVFYVFQVNGLHNAIHIITGLIFIWAALTMNAKPTNTWLGIVYLFLSLVGFFVPLTFLDMLSGADPDNFLHLFIGLISVWIGSTASDN